MWAHPSWSSAAGLPAPEPGPGDALLAQAAGCRVVASGWVGLGAGQRSAVLVDSQPGDRRWRDGLAKAIVEGLVCEPVCRFAESEGPRAVEGRGFDRPARQLAALIEGEVIEEGEEG